MTENLKRPLSFDEQVDRLIEHGMVVRNREVAIRELAQINYYRFTGYAFQFKNDNETYEEGILFEHVLDIYRFDQNLRNILRRYLEIIEVFARTQIAHHFSLLRCSNPPCDGHYYDSNFYDKKLHQSVMESLSRYIEHDNYTAFVQHHKVNYDRKMPLWVAVEVMSFTNLSKLYASMWPREQRAIAQEMRSDINYLKNHLRCLSELRNICAHGGRLYNRDIHPSIKMGKKALRDLKKVKNTKLFAYLIVLLRMLPEQYQKKAMVEEVKDLIIYYRSSIELDMLGFPENYAMYLYEIIQNQ